MNEMEKVSKYTSRAPDANGHIEWTAAENDTWYQLITRQLGSIKNTACSEYVEGLELLNLPMEHIPQLESLNKVLRERTGWETYPVPALIGFGKFFRLLADKKFPVATFIRTPEEYEYLQEPDIFHEIFGHCAMLLHPDFAEFTSIYGKLGAAAREEDRVWLARLYWFTVEFGIINTKEGMRAYGGGIISSPGETNYAINDKKAQYKPFDILDVLRTPYRIDIMQPIYFVIDSIRDLYDVAHSDIPSFVKKAQELGLYAPTFPPKEKKA